MLFKRVAGPDLRIAHPGAGHHEQRGDCGEQGGEQQCPDPDPVGPDAAPLRRALVESHRADLEPGSAGVKPEVEQARTDHDQDEGDRDRPDPTAEQGGERRVDGPSRSRAKSEGDPVEDAQGGQRGDDRGDLHPTDETGVDQADGKAVRKIVPRPTRSSAGDDSGWMRNEAMTTREADHRPDRQVEIADEESVDLTHGRNGQGDGDEQDVDGVGPVDEPLESGVGEPDHSEDQQDLERDRHPEPDLDRLCATCSCPGRCGGPCGPPAWTARRACSRGGLLGRGLGHGHAERRSPGTGHPGTSDDGLDDAELVELVARYLLDDRSAGHDQHPVAETG